MDPGKDCLQTTYPREAHLLTVDSSVENILVAGASGEHILAADPCTERLPVVGHNGHHLQAPMEFG